MYKCANCGNEFNGNFCPSCGAKAETQKFCPNCGTEVSGNTNFCSNCGNRISDNGVSKPTGATSAVAQTDELQNELYSLYKILEPVRELDLAGLAIDAKISELEEPLTDVNNKFYDDFAHYAPFISVDLDEDFLTPELKYEKKEWKNFIKGQKDKHLKSNYDVLGITKYCVEHIYDIFKSNESLVLSNLGASYLYYKMDFCYDPKNCYTYSVLLWDKKGKFTREYRVMNMYRFVKDYLRKKLGDNFDSYLMQVFTELEGRNRGEAQLRDMAMAYASVKGEKPYSQFYDKSDGYPEIICYKKRPCNMFEVEKVAKTKTKKSMREKQELDGSIAELRKMRKNIDNSIAEYMEDVDAYINKNITVVPFNYARQWRCVTYFLHLLVNKRGRDIYEVINQYEIDMKHKELTSALGDIHSEIRNQTKVLGNKLDTINRSIIEMTDAITSAISYQTKILSSQLDSINYSVISTGASIVGSIAQLGESMGQAMSNMKFNVTVG